MNFSRQASFVGPGLVDHGFLIVIVKLIEVLNNDVFSVTYCNPGIMQDANYDKIFISLLAFQKSL